MFKHGIGFIIFERRISLMLIKIFLMIFNNSFIREGDHYQTGLGYICRINFE